MHQHRCAQAGSCPPHEGEAAHATHLMSSSDDLLVRSMKSVSLGAMPSKTTLRMLDLPALSRRTRRRSAIPPLDRAPPANVRGVDVQSRKSRVRRVPRRSRRHWTHLLGPMRSTRGFLLPLVSTSSEPA